MSILRIIERLEGVAQGSEAVGPLRRMIVGLAISDRFGGAEERSATLETLRAGLSAAQGVDDQLELELVNSDDLPAAVRGSSAFVRLRGVADIKKGLTPIAKATPGPYPLVVTAQDRATCDHFDFETAAVIIPLVSSTGHGHASIHRLHYQEGRFALGSILCGVFSYVPDLVVPRFLYEYLSAFKDDMLVPLMLGTANVSLTVRKVEQVPIPVIDAHVQRRVATLMELCDELEVVEAEKEHVADQLAESLFRWSDDAASGSGDADQRLGLILREAARAITRPKHVEPFHGAVLDLGVGGRFTRPDRDNAQAVGLLDRLRTERATRQAAGAIPRTKKPDQQPDATLTERGWVATQLGDVCDFMTSGSRGWGKYYSDDGADFIRAQNVRFGRLLLSDLAHVRPPTSAEGTRTRVRRGDLLVVITGAGVTTPAAVDVDLDEAYVSQHVALIRPSALEISRWLLIWLMANGGGRAELVRRAYGAGKPGLNLTNLRTLPLLLPGPEEQHEIVRKIDQLTVAASQLGDVLRDRDETRQRLFQAALSDVLAPERRAETEPAMAGRA